LATTAGSSNSSSEMTATSACGRSKLMCTFIPNKTWRSGARSGSSLAAANGTSHARGASPFSHASKPSV
jgi:hypothetical protein